ncbi:MAG: CotH kinase family protein [Fibrobacter sp.]|nr:CotH kinase family protein [Fibrobacter sp.]
MKKMKEGLMAQWGLAMLLAFSMATSVFAQETELVITKQLDAAYVAVADNGGTATLTFEVQGGENVSYQWYRSSDGTNENGTVIDGATESSWTTPSFKVNKGNIYYCVATAGEKSVKSNVTLVANTGLPTLYVNTPNGIEIDEKERWIDETSLTLRDAGTDNFENVKTEFRGRGNSTWEQPKKPYAIKLKKNSIRSILGMPEHRRWVLIANYLDNSFLKNQVAFYLSKKLEMDYTVDGKFVNLVFNGVYRGLYWLGEAIKVDPNRVAIYDGEDGMTDGQDKDFLIEMDTHYDEVVKFTTPIRKMPYMVKNDDYMVEDVLNEKGKKVKDKYGNTVTQVSAVGQVRLDRFQDKIAALEKLLYPDYDENDKCKANTNDCTAPDEAYKDIIDVESWAKFWLINEIMDNTELNEPKSAYFTYQNKKEGDVFKAGPVWDFDAGATTTDAPIKLDTSIYYNALFKSPTFVAAVKNVWNTFFSNNIKSELESGIESAKGVLGTAAILDNVRWGAHNDYVQTTDLSFNGSVDFLKESVLNKMDVVNDFVNKKMIDLSTLTANYEAKNGDILTGELADNYKISIADGATVTLNGVSINRIGDGNHEWAGITCEGDCKIVLAEGTTNTVQGFHYNYPGIYVPEGKTLTIDGRGKLSASSGFAEDGMDYAAGIGGGVDMSCGNIVIKGGIITATGGGFGAGIGSGVNIGSHTMGNITISGGTVTAIVPKNGAGASIGSGYNEGSLTMGKITVSGGTVTAIVRENNAGASIGSGVNQGKLKMGGIAISGGLVTAKGTPFSLDDNYSNAVPGGAGIDAGLNMDSVAMGDIIISGGSVIAEGRLGAAGIGVGTTYPNGHSYCDSIVISGGTVIATGGDVGAGIGAGYIGGLVNIGKIIITNNVKKVIVTKGNDVVSENSPNMQAEHSIGYGDATNATGENGVKFGAIEIGGCVKGFITESPFVYPTPIADYAAVQIYKYDNGITRADLDGTFDGTDAVKITGEIKDVAVEYNRAFPVGAYSTIVLPFDVNTANVSGLQAVLYYNGIGKDKDGKDAIKMKVLWAEKGVIKDADGKDKEYEHTTISANTPYLVQMGSEKFEVKGPVTIVPTAEAVTKDPKWEWEFRGTWEYKKWAEGDPELGYAYGFAASEGTGINVGDFVKVGVGAWICPMRAYLVRSDVVPKAQGVRANGAYVMRPSVTQTELPEFMSIIVDNGDGDDDNAEHTTVIGHFNTRTGEIKMNYDRGKFDLKGRRVNGTNNARGAYYGKTLKK